MKPLVSILIPAYNAQPFIADTLRSALAQTWERKEIIVVDDGSTDQTLAIAQKFEPEGIRVITQRNQGAAAARNTLLSHSRGDYLQWLDADDLLSADKLSRQIEALDRSVSKRTLLSSGWAPFLYRHYRAEFLPTALWCDLSPLEWLLRKMEQNLHMQTATWLVSREISEAIGPWNTTLLSDDDGEYFCRALIASDGVRFVPGARIYYRRPGSFSLSHIGQSERKMEALWNSMELNICFLRSFEDSERVRAACVKYLQTWLMAFYPERPDLVKKAQDTARALGGELQEPRLSWKYAWIKVLFGWKLAKRARLTLPEVRATITRSWDRAMLRLDNRVPRSNLTTVAR